MNCRTLRLILVTAFLATAAGVASAQVYRWTDERGGINYGSKPPANARNVVRMNEDDGRVSTMPSSVPPEVIDSTRTRAEQRRADQLQRDLDAERRANRSAYGANTAADYQAWLEACRAERRVDCDDPNRGSAYIPGYAYGGPVYVAPPVVRPPGVRPPRPQPIPPVQQQPWPQGQAVVPSPPTGPGPRMAAPRE